jgi:MscS family membrane protein
LVRQKPASWACILNRALVVFLLLGSAVHSRAQFRKPAAPPPTKTEPSDPFGRETPRGSVMGFLKYEEADDFATAARYLQPASDGNGDLVQRAREMQALRARFNGEVGLLSDDPKGTVEAGLPLGEVRAGDLTVGGATVPVILVRVDDPESGKIWLFSQETVVRLPHLYALLQREKPGFVDRLIPAALISRRLLGMSLAQWLGWLLSMPISWLLAWPLGYLLTAPSRIWHKLRRIPFRAVWDTPVEVPLRCIIAILTHSVFVYLLHPPLLYRAYYARFVAALLAASAAWLVSRVADRGFVHVVNRTRTQNAGGESILIVMQRLTRILMIVIALLGALALLGVNVTATLAGLGIGGLAIALAAQKSLENIIGGVSLLADKAVHVGDFCQIGGRQGTVEDIGLRSLKLRTLDQSLVVVPNGALAQMQFENLKSRRKLLINPVFSLRIETQLEQLHLVLNQVQSMLDEHPAIESGTSRIRLNTFAGAAFELELFAYANTADWGEFTKIRQHIVLKIAEIVGTAGARFAGHTQLTYLSADAVVEAEEKQMAVHVM